MELAIADLAGIPLLFGPFPLPSTPPRKQKTSFVSRRLLAPPGQGSTTDGGERSAPPPSPPASFFGGGGIGPSEGANWPPSRKREEAHVLSILEKRVGSFKLNLARHKEDRLKTEEEKTEPNDTPDYRLPLLRKIISNRPLVVKNRNETDTEWYTSQLITECLCWHNVYRERHGAPPVAMCPDLCSYAQEWANTLAHTNTFRYRNNCHGIGQNVYCRMSVKDPGEVAGQQVASYWYSACRHYNYLKEPDVLHAEPNTGYFTQLIWASTCDVGIGIARSRGGKVMVVAHYRPAGNIRGAYQDNVFPPLTELSSDMSSDYS